MRDAVAICTRDRPHDLAACLESVLAQSAVPDRILVVDGSAGSETRSVVAALKGVEYEHTAPGLTRQRNCAVAVLGDSVDVVHFIDDDVILDPGYIEAIRAAFDELAPDGVGGLVVNVDPRRTPSLIERIFLLGSSRPGRILPTGRNLVTTHIDQTTAVDWLSGCSMSFRREILTRHSFDEGLTTHPIGEDVDFALGLGPARRLLVTPGARLVHKSSPVNRLSERRSARLEVVAQYRRVKRFPDQLSKIAFWWSAAGELALMGVYGLFRERSELSKWKLRLGDYRAAVRQDWGDR